MEARIPSSKGTLEATISYPRKKTGRLAILCPGYLDSKDYKHLSSLADALGKRGYAVVRFNPTGTWGSEGSISDYTTTQYLKDVKSALEYMLKRARYTRIVLGGHSRGGMVAILYAARDPRISLVLGIMPSSSRTMTKKRYDDWKRTGVSVHYRDLPNARRQKRQFRVPFSHAEDREGYNPVKDVARIKVPVILIAGESDKTVLPKFVKEIFRNANEPKSFAVVPGIGHDYRLNANEVRKVNSLILKLMQE